MATDTVIWSIGIKEDALKNYFTILNMELWTDSLFNFFVLLLLEELDTSGLN